MQRFEVTVADNKYSEEMQIGIRFQSSGYEDEMYHKYSSEDRHDSVFIARVATAVMARFCAYIFPKYEIKIELGKPHEIRYSYDSNPVYELRVIIKGYMTKSEQTIMIDQLNR